MYYSFPYCSICLIFIFYSLLSLAFVFHSMFLNNCCGSSKGINAFTGKHKGGSVTLHSMHCIHIPVLVLLGPSLQATQLGGGLCRLKELLRFLDALDLFPLLGNRVWIGKDGRGTKFHGRTTRGSNISELYLAPENRYRTKTCLRKFVFVFFVGAAKR